MVRAPTSGFVSRVRHHSGGLGILLFICVTCLLPTAAQFRFQSTPFRAGEHLTYKVMWSFIRLGTIEVKQIYADRDFPRFMQVWINGESSTGIPFVDVYFRSTSLLDIADPINILYELFSERDNRRRTTYVRDPLHARSFAIETVLGNVVRQDTIPAPVPYYDGPGLFMFTRCASGSDTTVHLPTVMNYRMGHTTIRFSPATENLEVPAFDHAVPSHPFYGSAAWEGSSFAGMSGEFSGWVSTDSTRTVLAAKVSIFLGSVTIELESIGGEQ